MIPIVLFAVALVVRTVAGMAFPGPAYPDSYYYVHVAEQLAAGNGFIVDYIWNLDDVGTGVAAALPVAANGLWMPLAEVVQVTYLWLLGPGPIASGLPFWIIGAVAAPLTFWIGRDAGFGIRPAVAAGLMAAVPGGLTIFLSQPDTFGLFMTLGALALWLCARGLRGRGRSFALGGLVVGLAALTRADGVLLGLPFAIVGVRQLWLAVRGRPIALGWASVIGCAVLFGIVVAPWLYRQLEVFGSLSPAAGSGRLMWLTDYQQLFSTTNPPTFDTWLAQGPAAIIASRVDGFLAAAGLFALLPLAFALTPFAAIGGWARRDTADFRPYFIYGAALLAVMVLVFPVLVPHGTFIHSAVALLPHTFLLVTVGIAAVVGWIARRRPAWDVRRATAVFTYGAVAIIVLGAALQGTNTIGRWAERRALHQELAAPLRSAPGGERFMAADPGAIHYLTGRQGIVTPNDPLAVIEDAMRTYDVRWLVLERDSIVPALAPVLAGEVRPAWLSRPVAVAPGASGHATATADPAATTAGPAGGALFAVCLQPNDTRCAP